MPNCVNLSHFHSDGNRPWSSPAGAVPIPISTRTDLGYSSWWSQCISTQPDLWWACLCKVCLVCLHFLARAPQVAQKPAPSPAQQVPVLGLVTANRADKEVKNSLGAHQKVMTCYCNISKVHLIANCLMLKSRRGSTSLALAPTHTYTRACTLCPINCPPLGARRSIKHALIALLWNWFEHRSSDANRQISPNFPPQVCKTLPGYTP